jgi:hypothetical protein
MKYHFKLIIFIFRKNVHFKFINNFLENCKIGKIIFQEIFPFLKFLFNLLNLQNLRI